MRRRLKIVRTEIVRPLTSAIDVPAAKGSIVEAFPHLREKLLALTIGGVPWLLPDGTPNPETAEPDDEEPSSARRVA